MKGPQQWVFALLCIIACVSSLNADGGHPVDPHDLPMDTAQMRFIVSNESDSFISASLYGVTNQCYKCDKQYLLQIVSPDTESGYTNISTQWEWGFKVVFTLANYTTIEQDFSYHLGEHGSYTLKTSSSAQTLLQDLLTDAQPIQTYLPLIVAVAVLVCLAIMFPLGLYFYTKVNRSNTPINYHDADVREENRQRTRVTSLDVFRGMCITLMIFVNYGGGGYWFFNHSTWNGLTVADLLFPWFIFIMGVAMPLSFQAMLKKGTSRTQLAVKLIRRSIILFALGLFINNGANILNWRIPGVLQRFGVSYLVTGFIILYVPTLGFRGAKSEPVDLRGTETEQLLTSRAPKYRSSFFPFLAQWVIAVVLLAVWFLVTFFLPVPGCPTGYLGPGGLEDGGKYFNCTGGAARYVDKKIFGLNHIYDQPTCQIIYHTGSYDPEGLLGCFTSIFLCFLGVQAGRIVQVHATPQARVLRWVGWGLFFGALGTLLCLASQNEGWIPINKNLWSPSFVFVMGGLGFLTFAACYLVVDVWRIWNGAPFIYVGMNSIIIYCGHETLAEFFPFNFYTTGTNSSHALFLASNILGVTAWVCIAYKMYLNKFFVNI